MQQLWVNVPKEWKVVGTLPGLNWCLSSEPRLFSEDIFRIEIQNRRFILDIGWYPEGAEDGCFVCRYVIGDNWTYPVEIFKTTNTADVMRWLFASINFVRTLEIQLEKEMNDEAKQKVMHLHNSIVRPL